MASSETPVRPVNRARVDTQDPRGLLDPLVRQAVLEAVVRWDGRVRQEWAVLQVTPDLLAHVVLPACVDKPDLPVPAPILECRVQRVPLERRVSPGYLVRTVQLVNLDLQE